MFNQILEPIEFDIDVNSSYNANYNENEKKIYFNSSYPDFVTSSHEFGHWVHNNVDFYLPHSSGNICNSHWFTKETTTQCSFVEGWAEYYSASCLDYWRLSESASKIEYTTGDYAPCFDDNNNIYQFLDYSQSLLCTNVDNKKVEGVFASFCYSLTDSYEKRALNYSGDNEDLHFSNSFLLNHLYRAKVLAEYNNYSIIEGFKDALIEDLSSFQYEAKVNSINALFNALINRNGVARPATPNLLVLNGNQNNRLLTWNDNTCPSSLSLQTLGYGNYFNEFNFYQNQENGFNIYRKNVLDNYSWDGTLNGYTLIHTTNSNTTNWEDDEVLNSGLYSYIVVAFNADGNSIPSAQVLTNCSLDARPDNLSLTNHISNNVELSSAKYNIEAGQNTYIILPSSDVTFCAGSNITLNPGFKVLEGGKFHSYIQDCNVCSEQSNLFLIHNVEIPKDNEIDNSHSAKTGIEIKTELYDCKPNPANSSTSINYYAPIGSEINFDISNIFGEVVIRLENTIESFTGEHSKVIDTSKFPSGTYFVTMRSAEKIETKKLIIIK